MFIQDSSVEEHCESAVRVDSFEDEQASVEKVSECRGGDAVKGFGTVIGALWGGALQEWETDDSIDDWETENSMCVSSVSESTWSSWEDIRETWSECEACPEAKHVRPTFGSSCRKSCSARQQNSCLLPSQIQCYYSNTDVTRGRPRHVPNAAMSDVCPLACPERIRIRTRSSPSFRLPRPSRVRLTRQRSFPLASQMQYYTSEDLLGDRSRHLPNSSMYSPLMPPPIVGFSPQLDPPSDTIFPMRRSNPIAEEIKYICRCLNPIPVKSKKKPNLQRASGQLT